ncbi:facilitated trehalose transporter Tret1-like isoform X2 [Sitophilus oryzae]|uniref:Facilitated trehalose transporter Tret1-like isoform X2 n=1 Tax=Sitophilus oryzae TaxID=7048 RepID=A0A6J2YEJ6_SITOR|nr:facilitated trehalose transporter Tret1-like isoform X2 [Sitophilus oryzae]
MKNIFKKLLDKEDETKLTQYMVVFTAGIYQGWAGPSLMKILSDEYPIKVTVEEASYVTIVGPVGHVIGGFSASYLADYVGRKNTVLAIGIPQVLSFFLIYFSYHSKYLLYISRILGGMGEGGALALLPCYIAEVAEPSVRGTLGTFVNLLLLFGQLFINTVGSFLTIHETAIICLIFPVIFWTLFIHMPESPYYCLMNKDLEGARKALQVLRRKKNVDKEVLQLSSDVDRQMSEKGSYKDLFCIKSNRKAFLLVCATRNFQVFTGSIALMSYVQIMISDATDLSPVMGSTVLIIAGVVMVVIASVYVDKFGRKPTLAISSLFTALTLLAQAVFLSIRDYTDIDVSSLSWLPLLIMTFNNLAFRGGLGVVTNIFISEIYSTSIKAKAMSLGSLNFAIVMIISTKLYQLTADYVGLAVPFYIFAITTFIGSVFFYFVLPETKGKTLETIQQELKGNVTNETKTENTDPI